MIFSHRLLIPSFLLLTSCYMGHRTVERPLKVGIVADAQYCPCDPNGTRYHAESLGKLREALHSFKLAQPSFVVQMGDLIEKDWINFPPTLAIFDSSDIPVFHVLGNHDYEVEAPKKDSVTAILRLSRPYYDFSREGWRFVVLDGNDLSFSAPKAHPAGTAERDSLYNRVQTENRPQAKTWNGGLGKEQMDWLEKTLASAAREQQRVIVFCHFPVFPGGSHNLWNDMEVLALLKRHPSVVAYFAGHNHLGDYGKFDGIHFITMQAMVETERENAYALLKLYADSLLIKGFGREPERNLRLIPR